MCKSLFSYSQSERFQETLHHMFVSLQSPSNLHCKNIVILTIDVSTLKFYTLFIFSIWYANTANLTECNHLLVRCLIGIWRAHTHITTPVLGIICFNELVCTIRELRIVIQHFNVVWQVRKENRFVPFNIPLGYIAVCNVTGVRTCACKYIMLSCAFSRKS